MYRGSNTYLKPFLDSSSHAPNYNALVNCISDPPAKPPRIVGILRSNSGANTLILHSFLALAPWEITQNVQIHTSIPGVGSQLTIDNVKPS